MIIYLNRDGVRKDPEIFADTDMPLHNGGSYCYCLWALKFQGAAHETR